MRPGLRMPPIRAFMDLTALIMNKISTQSLLRKVQHNIEMVQMKITANKSRSIFIIKGKLVDQCFYIGEEFRQSLRSQLRA